VERTLVVVHVRRDVIELGGMRTRGHDMKPEISWRGVSVGGVYPLAGCIRWRELQKTDE